MSDEEPSSPHSDEVRSVPSSPAKEFEEIFNPQAGSDDEEGEDLINDDMEK
jgi:hypothetical protein